MNDAELIREIASGRSEDAFRALVDRYVKMVYASCWRQLGNREMAEDATQAVFVLFSQKAGAVRHSNLAGWLLTTARYKCAMMRKMELRRLRRETAAAMERSHAGESGENELLAVLDDGLARLRGPDREAIALRYFQERSMGEVGETLGISEEAARKRVSRGVVKLRNYFARKGINVSTGVLPAILAEQRGAMTAEGQAAVTRGILNMYHGGAPSAIVTLVKGTDIMMQLARLKLAGISFLIAITALTGGWWSTRRVMADGNATQSTLAGTAAGTEAVAGDVESDDTKYEDCRQVLASIVDAHDRQDSAFLNSQLYFSPTGDPLLARIAPLVIDLDMAVYRVEKAAVARFGVHSLGLRFYWDTTAMALDEVLARIERKSAAVSSDTVILTPGAPFFPRPWIWPAAPIYFRFDQGMWKLDVTRTLQVHVGFHRRIPVAGETQEQMLVTAEKGLIGSFKGISQDIEAGKIETTGELQKRLDGAVIGVALQFSDWTVDIKPR